MADSPSNTADDLAPIRQAVRTLCANFPGEYWRKLDRERAYPTEFVSALTHDIPFYAQRHIVKPGLTGWAQVRFTYGASAKDAMEKLQYDLFYIKHMSITLDLMIMLETMKTVILRRGT